MALKSIIDEKIEDLATRLSTMMDSKIAALEKKFGGITGNKADKGGFQRKH